MFRGGGTVSGWPLVPQSMSIPMLFGSYAHIVEVIIIIMSLVYYISGVYRLDVLFYAE